MYSMRMAEDGDAGAILHFDHVAQSDSKRPGTIQRSITNGNCFVAIADKFVIGYVILDDSFYENGFIPMLYIAPDYRRQGVGESLMQPVEEACRTEKLFTSTNLSNTAMQRLLAKLGNVFSRVIHYLDEDDP